MSRTCPQCQAPILETQRFCRYCGYRLDEGFQDYQETKTYDSITQRMSPPVGHAAHHASLSPPLGNETMPLRAKLRRSYFRYVIFTLILLCVVGASVFFFQQSSPREQVASAPGIEMEPPTPALVPTPPPVPPTELPPAPPGPPLPPGHSKVPPQPINKLLLHAALTERKIDRLQRRLDSDKWLSAEQRQAILDQIKELEQQRLATLAVAEVFKNKSEALQNLLRGVIPTEEILKTIEVELQHLNKHRIRENVKQVRRLSDSERKALEQNINETIERLIKQLQQAQVTQEENR